MCHSPPSLSLAGGGHWDCPPHPPLPPVGDWGPSLSQSFPGRGGGGNDTGTINPPSVPQQVTRTVAAPLCVPPHPVCCPPHPSIPQVPPLQRERNTFRSPPRSPQPVCGDTRGSRGSWRTPGTSRWGGWGDRGGGAGLEVSPPLLLLLLGGRVVELQGFADLPILLVHQLQRQGPIEGLRGGGDGQRSGVTPWHPQTPRPQPPPHFPPGTVKAPPAVVM